MTETFKLIDEERSDSREVEETPHWESENIGHPNRYGADPFKDAQEVVFEGGIIEESTPASSSNDFKDLAREQQTGHCRHCGSKIQQSHKEILGRAKLDLLQMAAKHVIESGVKSFKKRDVADFANNPSSYNNFQKLRYHGLIAQAEGTREQWVITRNAWAFLRGDKELPKFVLVRNNHIVDRSPELISAKDVWRSNPEVITYFEYYDDNGQYVGVRPNTVPMVNQPSFL